jgi:hypothetical protein
MPKPMGRPGVSNFYGEVLVNREYSSNSQEFPSSLTVNPATKPQWQLFLKEAPALLLRVSAITHESPPSTNLNAGRTRNKISTACKITPTSPKMPQAT